MVSAVCRAKVESSLAKHLRSFLGQIVNSTFTTQGETAGAQAWSSFDTYCAPFIRYDNMSYEQVKQALQEFVFNINVPTRVGFQCPFSNLTFDIVVPKTLRMSQSSSAANIRTRPMASSRRRWISSIRPSVMSCWTVTPRAGCLLSPSPP